MGRRGNEGGTLVEQAKKCHDNGMLAIVQTSPLDEWIDKGRAIVSRRVEADWLLCDWMAEGKDAGHLTQTKFEFLQEKLGVAPKRLKDALKAAKAFPPSQRDASLSVEHHAVVASLPKDEALPLLKRASVEHLPVQAMREAVAQHRLHTGERFEDDDANTTLCTLIVRAWNRGTPAARGMFMDLAKHAKLSVIDEDKACLDAD